jgi:dTDP-4-dehydrorhamnose 3,5-epimerase
MAYSEPCGVPASIHGIVEYTLNPIRDSRGWVMRVADDKWQIPKANNLNWVQTTALRSVLGALRGFHFRADLEEWKLVRVISGRAFDVIVDLRPHSVSYLRSVSFDLTDDEPKMLLIPPGCAHAIQAVSPVLDFSLSVTVPYSSEPDRGFRWDDPTVGTIWPIQPPILSDRDSHAPFLSDISEFLQLWLGCDARD